MQNCYHLEVDVNGQEIFLVDKNVLTSFSGRLNKLFSKVTGEPRRLKVVFNDFPGGAEGFELIAKFCYNGGRIDLTLNNVFLLHSAANYMEMSKGSSHVAPGLIEQTNAYFKNIHCLNWSELVSGLKKCQELPSVLISSSELQQFLDCLIGKLSLPCLSSPRTSSSDNSSVLFSGDMSIDSTRSYGGPQTNLWFQDLESINIDMLEKVVRTMIVHKLDHSMISSFLSHYKDSNFPFSKSVHKYRIIEAIINLLSLLNRTFISVKGLFGILQESRRLKISKCCTKKLEVLIGSQMDRAKIDDLLIPSELGKRYAYDVDLILKLVKIFLRENNKYFFIYRLKKVGELIDLFIMEVAPDKCLQPSKFLALATALPDIARDSHKILYEGVDIYFKVHNGLSAEEKIKITCALNYDKLSEQTLIDLSNNENFPASASVVALVTKQNAMKHLRTFSDLSLRCDDRGICSEHNGYESHHQDPKIKKLDLQSRGKKIRSKVKSRRKLQINVTNNFASMHKLCA